MKDGLKRGAVAQLGEHLLCKQGVVGSIPISSTSYEGRRRQRAELSEKRLALIFGSVPRRFRSFFNNREEVKRLARKGGFRA